MFWEKITVNEFAAARESCGKVCVIPIGCLEKHGNHLPLGTDILTARTVAARAAEIEDVMIFPYLPFGIVSEVKHKLGTIALSSQLQYDMLEELCDEIARNGFTKILFLNGHGGNTQFLRYFTQSRHEHPCNYTAFVYDLSYLTPDEYNQFVEFHGEPIEVSGHADIYETSTTLAIAPEQVKMEALKQDGFPLGRMDDFAQLGIFCGISWYASFPEQMAGEPSKASAERGEMLLNFYVKHTADILRKMKSDELPNELQEEFYAQCDDPQI